jgi:regulation of enolase protein 1 (concanavalin A-like superfamily)
MYSVKLEICIVVQQKCLNIFNSIKLRLEEGDRQGITMKKKTFIFTIALSVVALCLLSQISSAAAAPAYQDEFTSSNLQTFWTFTNPLGTGSYSLTAHSGYLRITAPTGVGLSKTSNFNAPRMLQPVTGDFVATTSVSGDFSQAGFRGGMLLFKDTNNYFRLEKYGSNQVLMYGYINGAETYIASTLPSNYSPLYLELERTGTTLRGYWSSDGATWNLVKQYTVFNGADTLQIGLFTINVGTSTFSADFDYFHITPASILSVLPENPLGVAAVIGSMFGAFAVYTYRKAHPKTIMKL